MLAKIGLERKNLTDGLAILVYVPRCSYSAGGVSEWQRGGLFTGLVLLSAISLASAQAEPPRKPLPTEPMEEYDMPPAPMPLWGIGVSPGMISVHDQFTSHQVNVNAGGLNITGDAANEPSIAVDPTNGNKMVIGWRQFNSVSSNFRQSGYGYTSNAGATWTFPACSRITFSGATRSWSPTIRAGFFTTAFFRPSSTTSGARSTRVRPGRTCKARATQRGATSSGTF